MYEQERIHTLGEIGYNQNLKYNMFETSEIRIILRALKTSMWRQDVAARIIGITPRVMTYKCKKYRITHPFWRYSGAYENIEKSIERFGGNGK